MNVEHPDGDMNPLEAGTLNGTPISVLLSQAVKIKSAQQASLRKKFDSFPIFLQNSMFAGDEMINARQKPFKERFETANRFKNIGNTFFREKRFYDAKVQYEAAISMFRFLSNINPSWKDVGILDEDIRENIFSSKDYTEVLQVNDFLVSCLNNLALTCLQTAPCLIQDAIQSCNVAIDINPKHSKAYYLRCKARIGSKSAGREEEKLALEDIQKAKSIEPSDKYIVRLYSQMNKDRISQKKKELKSFGNMFSKGISPEYQSIDQVNKKNPNVKPPKETKFQNQFTKKNRFALIFVTVLVSRFLLIWIAKSVQRHPHKNVDFPQPNAMVLMDKDEFSI